MSVLKLAEAKRHLGVEQAVRDVDLQAMIDAAEAVIANHVGPLEATEVTTRVRGYMPGLALPITPVLSLTSVTSDDESTLTVDDLYVNAGGVVVYGSGLSFGARYYDVAYQAGRTTCPPDLLMAVKELVRHLWQTQRGPTRRPGSAPSESVANTVPGAAYALPFRVSELIGPHRQFGIA
jgi:hypothetical protein